MKQHGWVDEFDGAVTVCDADGTIVEMNSKSAKTFEGQGGLDLIGKNLLDCHPEPARTRLEKLMRDRKVNIYTIEKNGKKKMIYQAPWFDGGRYMGFIEIAFYLPDHIPHFIRK